jgi:hypothetical protein
MIKAQVNLSIVQPAGYVHSLGFLDQARYFGYQFKRLGANVTLTKNRLRHDAINFIFGAHLGFDAALKQRNSCIFVNLEQLGSGGANVPAAYMNLLENSPVVDYDSGNVASYTKKEHDVPIINFLYAPYLISPALTALADRPIDILFIGSMNERRNALIRLIEAQGLSVTQFDSPLYGPERDLYIKQAKCVFNSHFYASSRFEQARVSHCLSLGTPVVSERTTKTSAPKEFEDAVFWVQENNLADFFKNKFKTLDYYRQAEALLINFQKTDPIQSYSQVLRLGLNFQSIQRDNLKEDFWKPSLLNAYGANNYKPGWLNLSPNASLEPDMQLDLGQELHFPLTTASKWCGLTFVELDSVELLCVDDVGLVSKSFDCVMQNSMRLLKLGGCLIVRVPYGFSPGFFENTSSQRLFNEFSWKNYTDKFWKMDWFEHSFKTEKIEYFDVQSNFCERAHAVTMSVILIKVETTPAQKNLARVMRSDFLSQDFIE